MIDSSPTLNASTSGELEGPLCVASGDAIDSFPLQPLHFWPHDTAFELISVGVPQVMKFRNGSINRFLQDTLDRSDGYEKYLTQYPSVKCEPLNNFYLWKQASAKLNPSMLEDLLFGATWREAVWGVWLAALAPSIEFVAPLIAKRPSLPHSSDLVDMATTTCQGRTAPVGNETFSALLKIRQRVQIVDCPQLPLREFPRASTLRREIEQLNLVMRSRGAQEAHKLLSKGRLGFYRQHYLKWIAEGAVPF